LHPSQFELGEQISKRENCPLQIVGRVTGDGKVVVRDSFNPDQPAIDLPLELVLGKMPQKTFRDNHSSLSFREVSMNWSVMDVLYRVLRLINIGSKRFLVNKVDRSVTGLIAQQQYVGPLQLPLSNVAVIAHSHFL